MCGIFGVTGRPGLSNAGMLERAANALYHRGPDGSRWWMDENHSVGLAHARLSIIDLEGGSQPLHNESHTVQAVVNGEFYDYIRIRDELIEKGHLFSTASDSEVLIHLYEEYGVDCVKHLRGEFAFILWDQKKELLFACRDRFGTKPLYFSFFRGDLYLASEIKALVAVGIPSIWDEESLHFTTQTGAVSLQDRTLFKDIYQVPPGYLITMCHSQFQKVQYWDFNYPTLQEQESKFYSEQDVIEQFREIFEESVRLRLKADVPVGVYLSGGLDSSSIVGTIGKISSLKTRAFTLSFLDQEYDEFSIAKEMAELAGAEFNSYQITPQMMADNFVEAVRHSETLMTNMNSISKFILSRNVRDSGCKVVLTGEGSDEILGGYVHFRQDVLLHDVTRRIQENRTGYLRDRMQDVTSDGMGLVQKFQKEDNAFLKHLGYVPSWICPMMAGGRKLKSLVKKQVYEQYAALDPYEVFLGGLDIKNQLTGRHVLHQSQYLWSKLFLPNYMLTNLGDRMEMAHGVEGRVPFLDHKLVEFVSGLPAGFKIRGTQEKHLLRESMKPVLSNTVYERKKHPFMAPPTSGNKKDVVFKFLSEYVCDNASNLPYFEGEKIKGMLRIMPLLPAKAKKNMDIILMMFASMIALQDHYKMQSI
jgi:asparagine synthase (glutamine-hydrolysing)